MKIKIALLLLLYTVVTLSCRDIIEKDIRKDQVTLLSPTDKFKSNVYSITFTWNDVEGATKYNIQIVEPSFANPNRILVDSNVSVPRFTYTFPTGNYQWKVKAFNNGYSTEYVIRSLSVDSTTNLSKQILILKSPANDLATNSLKIKFTWDSLPSATQYQFQLLKPDYTIVKDQNVNTTSLELTLPTGDFKWQVRAQNQQYNSLFSTPRTLTIDTIPPNYSSELKALNDSTIGWSRDLSAIGDSIYIGIDTAFTIGTAKYKYYTTDLKLVLSKLPANKYFGKFRTFDKAGNKSAYSPSKGFSIK